MSSNRDALPPECRPDPKGAKKSKGTPKTKKGRLTPNECELRIIRDSIDQNLTDQGPAMKRSPETARIYSILVDFLQKERVICYGGIAVNASLPKSAQFYGPNDLPDYDALSVDAMSTAKRLVDIYIASGFSDAEARAGVHLGTYKVFVNFIGVLDLTDVPAHVFDVLETESVKKKNIRYAPPTWLRMAMHQELSRPLGDVSRWEKVDSRLQLLERHHPWKKEKISCTFPPPESPDDQTHVRCTLFRELVSQQAVFFGDNAVSAYQETPTAYDGVLRSLVDNVEKSAAALRTALRDALGPASKSELISRPSVSDIVPESVQVFVDRRLVAVIYQTNACYGFNEIPGNALSDFYQCTAPAGKKVRVATTDTAVFFLVSLAYTADVMSEDQHHGPGRKADANETRSQLLFMAQAAHFAAAKHRLDQSGVWRRFRLPCLGVQPTLETIRAKNAAMFRELKGKRGEEYDRWFLKYAPGASTASSSASATRPRITKPDRGQNSSGVLAFLGIDTRKKPTRVQGHPTRKAGPQRKLDRKA